MDDVFVGRVMSTDLVTVRPDTQVEEAARVMMEHEIGSVLVVDEAGRLEGILTSTDFVQIVAERSPKDRTPVSTYMTEDLITATAQDLIETVADLIVDHGVHHVPVVDGEEPIGIVTTTDLTAYLAEGI